MSDIIVQYTSLNHKYEHPLNGIRVMKNQENVVFLAGAPSMVCVIFK